MIQARKGERRATFSEMAWKTMGKNKNGWVAVSEKTGKPETPEEVLTDEATKALIESAKGFQTDQKYAKALEVYLKITNPSPAVKGQITKLRKLVSMDEAIETELKTAEKLMDDGQFGDAAKSFKKVLGLDPSHEMAKEMYDICISQ